VAISHIASALQTKPSSTDMMVGHLSGRPS
jgi:hypothetical protein